MATAHYIPRPHVSAAVKQLRVWVSLCAGVFALAAATQMLVFGFAQYTDVRWTEVREVKLDKPLRVVGGTPMAPATTTDQAAADGSQPADAEAGSLASSTTLTTPKSENFAVGGVRGRVDEIRDAVDVNRVKTSADRVMHRASAVACGVGVISAIMLAVFVLLGVVVAGGGCIPGVERVVTAGSWSLLLALMCLPWNALLPTLGIPGVFVGYEAMTGLIDKSVEAGSLGSFAALAQWVGAPLLAMFTSLGVCMWFRAGVDRGVIVTSPSELDKAVEREVEMISKRGVGASTPKAVGALNRAIGDDDPSGGGGHSAGASMMGSAMGHGPASGDRTLSAVERAIEQAAHTATSLAEETTASGKPRRTRSVADGDFKRPI